MKLEQVQAQPLAHCVPALLEEAAACRRRRPEEFTFTLRAAAPGADAAGLFEPQNCRGRRFEAHVEQLRQKTRCEKRRSLYGCSTQALDTAQLAAAPTHESIRVARKNRHQKVHQTARGWARDGPGVAPSPDPGPDREVRARVGRAGGYP